MRETIVKTEDGRDLQVRETGDLDGFPVFTHHGTPSSRLLLEGTIADAEARGIRLISHDRPGYGASTRHHGRAIADVVPNVIAIADHLGIERFASWGVSGGGPHVLACAARLADRCVAAASMASVAPYKPDEFDFFDGMGQENIDDFKLALEGEDKLRPGHEAQAQAVTSGDPADMIEGLRTLLSPVDEAVLTGEVALHFIGSMNEGLSNGVDGWVDDDLAFVRPWGFEFHSIEVPVLLWQGREDRFVPFGHGQWLARQIPGADARLSDEDGHLTLILNRIGETHQWLLDHA